MHQPITAYLESPPAPEPPEDLVVLKLPVSQARLLELVLLHNVTIPKLVAKLRTDRAGAVVRREDVRRLLNETRAALRRVLRERRD